MYLAHIAPTSVLDTEIMKSQPFHLCIASQVLKDPVYAAFYRDAPGFVMLDVPTREEKDRTGSYPLDKLIEAIRLVQPNEVVLPDVWGSSSEVGIVCAMDASMTLRSRLSVEFPALSFLAVPRGRDLLEYRSCAIEMSRIPGVQTLGIVSGRYEKVELDRAWASSEFKILFPKLNLHLLGVQNDMIDIQNLFIRKRVRSADTAKLVRWSLDCKMPMFGNIPDYPGRGPGYFEREVSELQMSYVSRNINYWNKLCS